MSIAKETAIAVPALTALLFLSHIFLGADDGYREFTIVPKSWLGVAIPAERFLAKDLITGRASGAVSAAARWPTPASGPRPVHSLHTNDPAWSVQRPL